MGSTRCALENKDTKQTHKLLKSQRKMSLNLGGIRK
jgi:hypothetical protein